MFFYCPAAASYGVAGHPQIEMWNVADDLGFEVTRREPYSLSDGWFFEIEWCDAPKRLPPFLTILSSYGIVDVLPKWVRRG